MCVALFIATIWTLIGVLIRNHPKTMAGYNTMPKQRRDEIDIKRIAVTISNAMFIGAASMAISPLLRSKKLFCILLVLLPVAILILSVLYVNIFAKRFRKPQQQK